MGGDSMTVTRILGIDPGIARMGYGVVDVERSRLRAVTYGCIETSASLDVPNRLNEIYCELSKIISEHHPHVMAIEELFFYRNTTTAFVVGQARGIAILAGVQGGLEFAEYTPMQVKQAVSGYGKADKKQVQEMVRMLLNLTATPKPDDTADALAVAITYAHSAALRQAISLNKKQTQSRGVNYSYPKGQIRHP
jgi:crossover junction endodeoxyribonuclease RuvC